MGKQSQERTILPEDAAFESTNIWRKHVFRRKKSLLKKNEGVQASLPIMTSVDLIIAVT
jgi:hypothetical protein